jgi:hypothetical protein
VAVGHSDIVAARLAPHCFLSADPFNLYIGSKKLAKVA